MKNGDITQLPELVKILEEEEEEKMAVRETKTGLETGVAGLTISPQVKKSIFAPRQKKIHPVLITFYKTTPV